eukprot:gene4190-3028_t
MKDNHNRFYFFRFDSTHILDSSFFVSFILIYTIGLAFSLQRQEAESPNRITPATPSLQRFPVLVGNVLNRLRHLDLPLLSAERPPIAGFSPLATDAAQVHHAASSTGIEAEKKKLSTYERQQLVSTTFRRICPLDDFILPCTHDTSEKYFLNTRDFEDAVRREQRTRAKSVLINEEQDLLFVYLREPADTAITQMNFFNVFFLMYAYQRRGQTFLF